MVRRVSGVFKTLLAHRYAWFLAYGRWPKDKLLHHCDNPPCCEVTHLFEGTDADNMLDAKRKGRIAVGERHGNCKFPNSVVKQVRAARGSIRGIAAEFGMSTCNVSLIRNNKIRTDVL